MQRISERQLSSLSASCSSSGANAGSCGQSRWWSLAVLPFAAATVAATASLADDLKEGPTAHKDFHLLPLSSRQRIFFKYEKRVRDKSPLDKVFEYFSSVEKDGLKYMQDVDLLRAVVPTYPPTDTQYERSGSLDGERPGKPQPFWSKAQTGFLRQFDVDGDGLISYPEFLLVLTLFSIPGRDVQTIFEVVDLDGNGVVDAQEFKTVMELLQAKANMHGSAVGRSHKLAIGSDSGILVSFFGRDGTKKLQLGQFSDFLARLHEELVRLEFAHYDVGGRGSICGVDFAHSLIATTDMRSLDRLLDKVEGMSEELQRRRVGYADFHKLHLLQRNLHTMQVALDFYEEIERPMTRADFAKLLRKLPGIALSPHVLDIVFHVFDDGKGHLDVGLFLEVMQRREIMWARRRFNEVDAHPPGSLLRIMACLRKCAFDD